MRYAERQGVNLEIDLARGNIERVETEPKDTELFLGGQGTAAKIIFERGSQPTAYAFSPD
jgi:aldehyde:ferredoxin oxidoreductase